MMIPPLSTNPSLSWKQEASIFVGLFVCALLFCIGLSLAIKAQKTWGKADYGRNIVSLIRGAGALLMIGAAFGIYKMLQPQKSNVASSTEETTLATASTSPEPAEDPIPAGVHHEKVNWPLHRSAITGTLVLKTQKDGEEPITTLHALEREIWVNLITLTNPTFETIAQAITDTATRLKCDIAFVGTLNKSLKILIPLT